MWTFTPLFFAFNRSAEVFCLLSIMGLLDGDDEYESIGKMLFYLTISEDDALPYAGYLEAKDVSAGWKYFASLTNSDGGITLDTFEAQVRKIVKRVIKESGVEDQLLAFGMMAAGTFLSSEDEAKDKVSKLKSMILDKMLDAIPSFAKAVFKFFGNLHIQFFSCFACVLRGQMQCLTT
jgi:hypothetical protein